MQGKSIEEIEKRYWSVIVSYPLNEALEYGLVDKVYTQRNSHIPL